MPNAASDSATSRCGTRLTALWETPPTWAGWLATVDHKTLGKRYIYTALAFSCSADSKRV